MKISYIVFILAILQSGVVTELLLARQAANSRIKVCSKLVSYRASQNIPYLETYRERTWGPFYKTKVRWNYRTEYSTSWRHEYTCCDGYSKISHEDSMAFDCEPTCQPNCGNGTCIKPNVCVCYHGYAREEHIVFDSVCVPVCIRTCVHGKCTAPDDCTCDHGYSLSDDGYTCEPVCTMPCGKGAYCSAPGVCTCLSGYAKTSTTDCVPICKNECVHAKCTAPDTCTCDDGYEPDDVFVCKPKCKHGCLYGKCTAPNMCTCDTGYSLRSPSVCEPICSQPCAMGTCVAPESCSCFKGYGLLENSKYICEPFCEKACLNGVCTAPDECTCNKGFKKTSNMWTKHICQPHCELACEPFGVCTAPNVCMCFHGYRLVDKNITESRIQYATDTSVCEPICHTPCIKGYCSAPDTCTCNDGYYPSDGVNTNLCTPRCHHECVNGFCSAPETCTCKTGYHPSRNNQSNICEPLCEKDCVNAYCSAPNKCSCNIGYQPQLFIDGTNDTSVCRPVCEPSCKNGVCVQPDVCNCNAGYRRSASSMNACDPICHPACKVHGNCVAPDSCICQNGYRMIHYNDVNVPFGCEPICSVECGNGTCTAPEVCTCTDGYRNAETGECVPVCTACDNGTCVAPEVCKCDDGFFLVDIEVPESHIAFDENRTRSENRSNGNRSNGSRCMPRCEGCDDGECVAPDKCRCHAGYVKIEGTCVHACHHGCGIHGKCVEERKSCECHYGWTGPRCDQPTLCILSMNGEENRTESLNIVEEQNATIEYVLLNNPACSECIDELNNETLCFNMYFNGTNNETRIVCIMDGECLTSSGKYESQRKIVKLNAIASAFGLLFSIGITIAGYAIFRKLRNRRQMNIVAENHRTSMQGLVEQHTVDSECE